MPAPPPPTCSTTAGFARLDETVPFPTEPGSYFVVRGGSLVAWDVADDAGPADPFRIVGAHTDSPNLRIKPQPDLDRAGWQLLGVEVYGGPLLNSWLDRDLGLSGRVAVRGPAGPVGQLLSVDEPLLRVSQLAIHLNRGVNTDGLVLNPQQHLAPHWGLGSAPGDLRRLPRGAARGRPAGHPRLGPDDARPDAGPPDRPRPRGAGVRQAGQPGDLLRRRARP